MFGLTEIIAVSDAPQDLQGTPFYFDDYVVGAEHAAGSYDVTAQEIIEFARKWDPQPWHIDEAVAKASPFGGLTACSAHIFSIFCIRSYILESSTSQSDTDFNNTAMNISSDDPRLRGISFCENLVFCAYSPISTSMKVDDG